MVCLKRRLGRRQNLGVIWFLAESRHVGRVGDFPAPVHHEGRPAGNSRNDADFARCVRQSVIWRPVESLDGKLRGDIARLQVRARTVTACPLNLTIPKRSVVIFPPTPPSPPQFPEKWRMVRVRGAPLAGFEPTTYCLEGRCSVR